MAEKVRTGQYQVGDENPCNSRDNPKTIGVIKGEAVNDISHGAFRRHMSVTSSKWFIYEIEELLASERGVTTGSYVCNVASLIEEYNTKSEAVTAAKRRYNL